MAGGLKYIIEATDFSAQESKIQVICTQLLLVYMSYKILADITLYCKYTKQKKNNVSSTINIGFNYILCKMDISSLFTVSLCFRVISLNISAAVNPEIYFTWSI